MAIELPKPLRERAVLSIERHAREELDAPIGNIEAAAWLEFFLAEIAPSVYNQAIADAQQRLMQRVGELDIECHAEEFAHRWPAARKPRR